MLEVLILDIDIIQRQTLILAQDDAKDFQKLLLFYRAMYFSNYGKHIMRATFFYRNIEAFSSA